MLHEDIGGAWCGEDAWSMHRLHLTTLVQWSEDVIKADPFFGRSRVRFHMPP